jgi:predicted DNA binding CopG/RHH family protein
MREEYDFSNAKRAIDIPHLANLQSQEEKTSINLTIDNDVLASFRLKAQQKGVDYETLINSTLSVIASQFF